MLAARTIGGLISLVAGVLALAGLRVSRRADAVRLASLERSARFVGVFLCVWLVRDGAELALTYLPITSLARAVDLLAFGCASLLALALMFAPRIAKSPPLRVALAVIAGLGAASGVWRMLS